MTLSERSAYLKGLMEGLQLDGEKPENKMIRAIVDMLEDVAYAISDIEDNAQAVSDELDMIEEELDTLGEVVFDEEDDNEEDEYDFGDALYEFKCPTCGEVVTIDEEMLEEGSMVCPKCGEELEFDPDDVLDGEGDDDDDLAF